MNKMTCKANSLSRLSQQCRDNSEAVLCRGFTIVATPSRQFSTQCVEIVLSLHAQFDEPKIMQTLSAQLGVRHFEGIVAAMRRQSESGFLSLAPGFSQVVDAGEGEKPFQRFLRAGGKPLKRFARHTVVNTRLKPGANEKKSVVDKHSLKPFPIHSAAALAQSTPRRHAERPLAGLLFTAHACLASYVTKLIPKKQLEQKLHQTVRLARARLEEGRWL